MTTIINKTDIEFSEGNTLDLKAIPQNPAPDMTLKFQIADNENNTPLFDNTYSITADEWLNITDKDGTVAGLSVGHYIYRMIVYSGNRIETQQSGSFEVKWGV